jgi:hypothetical protein
MRILLPSMLSLGAHNQPVDSTSGGSRAAAFVEEEKGKEGSAVRFLLPGLLQV